METNGVFRRYISTLIYAFRRNTQHQLRPQLKPRAEESTRKSMTEARETAVCSFPQNAMKLRLDVIFLLGRRGLCVTEIPARKQPTPSTGRPAGRTGRIMRWFEIDNVCSLQNVYTYYVGTVHSASVRPVRKEGMNMKHCFWWISFPVSSLPPLNQVCVVDFLMRKNNTTCHNNNNVLSYIIDLRENNICVAAMGGECILKSVRSITV